MGFLECYNKYTNIGLLLFISLIMVSSTVGVKVYISPSKALVQEKLRDWNQKFNSWGISCLELTGDNENYSTRNIQDADIILTTPEVRYQFLFAVCIYCLEVVYCFRFPPMLLAGTKQYMTFHSVFTQSTCLYLF